ncbi:MAG: glucose-6-phosphate dehydrogenase assembly protein OpcA, partial [Bryobacteraceae bacterium]
GEIIGELMHEHPSRAIVIRQQPDSDLAARVFAQCWMPFGKRQQICCEQIEITAPAERMPEVSSSILPLMAPDLPVVLWCRGPQWFAPTGYDKLLSLADKAIFDTASLSDPARGLARLRVLRSGGRRVADLTWTRLTVWREMIAQAWSEGALRDVTSGDFQARVTYSDPRRSPGACYLAAWLERTLPGRKVEIAFEAGDSVAGVSGVRLKSAGAQVDISANNGALELKSGANSSRLPEPPQTEYEMMREELSILNGDSRYEAVLGRAADLAATVN